MPNPFNPIFNCYRRSLASFAYSGSNETGINETVHCSMNNRDIDNPRTACSHCKFQIRNDETYAVKTDFLRKKSIRYRCTKCRNIFYDMLNDYRYCPHCARLIVRLEREEHEK